MEKEIDKLIAMGYGRIQAIRAIKAKAFLLRSPEFKRQGYRHMLK